MNSPMIDRLWTRDFIFMSIANFMMSFSFYLLIPTLPFYLIGVFGAGKNVVGIILSIYTISVLCIRPFSGFLADTFSRKPLFLIAYFAFASIFIGYLLAGALLIFTILRIFHGFAFGMLATTGNTLVIDIMPSSRRGEGLGYYGVMGNLAMAIGPMTGLFLKDYFSFDAIFITAIATGFFGFIFAVMVKAPQKLPQKKQVISLDRFFIVQGIPAGITLLLIAIPYAMTNSYIALYVHDLGITSHSGFFFSVMAVGMILSRVASGKKVDHGLITQNIRNGIVIALIGIFGEIFLNQVVVFNLTIGYIVYYLIAFFIGYGFGTVFPAINTLFINLAANNRRASANATYLTSWDVGIGLGVFLGGNLSEWQGFRFTYIIGTICAFISLLVFVLYATPHFVKHRVR
ncbi:MAG: MFS transporter [Bacteroidales bacterium]|nr:MFS transporter [Bacteroidales bacterium]